MSGFVGHHINSVAANDLKMARDPGNIRFIKGSEHLPEHGGDWRTPTSGSLIDLGLGGAALMAFVLAHYDAKMQGVLCRLAVLCRPADSWRSYHQPGELARGERRTAARGRRGSQGDGQGAGAQGPRR